MPFLRTSLSQFSLVDGRRRNHTDAIACREPSRRPFGPSRAHLYLLAEHAAANGHEHRFCQVVMREVQLAFAAEEDAGAAAALTRALMLVNRNLWHGGQELPAHKRLPIGLVAVAIEGSDAYLCQVATGQVFVTRGDQVDSVPTFEYWRDLLDGSTEPAQPLGQSSDFQPRLVRCQLAPGDRIVLASTNLARLIDRDSLSTLAASHGQSPVAGLSQLSEDFGLLNTCGMVIEVASGTEPATTTPPLLLKPVGLEELVAVRAAAGLVERFSHAVRRAPAPPDSPALPMVVAAEVLAQDEPPASVATVQPVVDEPLPDNMIRLYHTPPMTTVGARAPAIDPAEVPDQTEAPVADTPPPAPRVARRSRRARWLDALAVSMVVASETLRRPSVPATRPVSRRVASSRVVTPQPDVVFRGLGRLSLASASGFAIPQALSSALRWPAPNLNNALVIAMVIVVAMLALVARNVVTAPRDSPTAGSVEQRAGSATRQDQAPPAVAAASDTQSAPVAAVQDTAAAAAAVKLVQADAADRAAARLSSPLALDSPRVTLTPAVVLADLGASNTPATTPKQLIVGRGNVYVLDPFTSTLYLVDSTGKPQTTLLARGWSIAKEKVADLVGVTWRGDTLVVIDRSRAYTLDGPSGTWRVTPLAAAGLGAGVHQVASYDGGLYVLDSARGQVLKFAQGAYQKAPQPWLKSTDKADLAGAVDLAIDGRIYALTGGGQLVTLLRGAVERRQEIAVSPPLQSPAALVSPPNSPYLYIGEAGGRVLKLTKDGNVVGQYEAASSGELANLSSFWVDESTDTVYAVAGNKVVRVGLPTTGRDRHPLS